MVQHLYTVLVLVSNLLLVYCYYYLCMYFALCYTPIIYSQVIISSSVSHHQFGVVCRPEVNSQTETVPLNEEGRKFQWSVSVQLSV